MKPADKEFPRHMVCVRQGEIDGYPKKPPFDPDPRAVEYGFGPFSGKNDVYEEVRNVLHDLGLDQEKFATMEWNPFRALIKPGDKVVIKPNLVIDAANQDAVTTHASVIRPVIDYAWKAMEGRGEIIVCDAPMVETDIDKVISANGLRDMLATLVERGYRVAFKDLRARRTIQKNSVVIGEVIEPEKWQESVTVDLKDRSLLDDDNVKMNRLSDGSYRRSVMRANHQRGKHRYQIATSVLEADVVISIPKLKTHKKAGITCCLKNLVGINVDKDYLPHFTLGPANRGGDEFPPIAAWRLPLLAAYKLARLVLLGGLRRYTAALIASCAAVLRSSTSRLDREDPKWKTDVARKVYHVVTGTDYGGSWQGNETIWRMILDLNRIFLHADANGVMAEKRRRRNFFLVDAVIAGVRNGPLTPHVLKPGVVAAGFNAALVDLALIRLAGIDAARIPLYREILTRRVDWLCEDFDLLVMLNGERLAIDDVQPIMRLEEPNGWAYTENGAHDLPSCREPRRAPGS